MTSLYCEEKDRETSPTLVTWVTSTCASSDAASTRNVTWPSNLRRLAFSSSASVQNRARPPPPWTTYLVPRCVLSKGIRERKRKVTICCINKISTCFRLISSSFKEAMSRYCHFCEVQNHLQIAQSLKIIVY